MTNKTPFEQAVEAAGSLSALGRALGVTHQAIGRFKNRGFFPPKRALEIETLYGIPAKSLVDPAILEMADLLNG